MEKMTDDKRLDGEVPAWRKSDWAGPKVELRSQAEDGETWPEGAVERVVFTLEEFPNGPAKQWLPFVQFFATDGWPLACPNDVRSLLDERMKAEFHARPWSASRWTRLDWLSEARNFDDFQRWNEHTGLLTGPLACLVAQSG